MSAGSPKIEVQSDPMFAGNIIVTNHVPANPCAMGFYGSWVLKPGVISGEYRTASYVWKPHGCFPHFSAMLGKLVDNNVKHVVFLGDSHIRVLFEHLYYLASGKVHSGKRQVDSTLKLTTRNKQRVVMTYKMIDGIFQDGTHHLCQGRGKSTGRTHFPSIAGPIDLLVVGVGHWEMAFCRKRYDAFVHYLPLFLDYTLSLRTSNASKAIWVTAPPWNAKANHCWRRTLARVSWANAYASELASSHYNMQIFDRWNIETSRFDETCDKAHMSCPNVLEKRMNGAVGSVTTQVFMSFLAQIFHT
eukprot:CAMPEP_0118957828 /NCGR_PEP_ID=MMETSP1169-20130426/62306_1 /TAXON_ID=36882 /ORGANISM="Pyramimonas obovata, Strain CCMP722" /LENGTH=301 /DNA_ID=CAMNT_0006905929 /DNA_START=564 /DNA_END=1469 /DNA_ORIENTATION=-